MALTQVESFDVSVASPDRLFRYWRDFKAVPMAANLQLMFYRNNTGKVLVQRNEQAAHVPVPTENFPFYDWQKRRAFFVRRITESRN